MTIILSDLDDTLFSTRWAGGGAVQATESPSGKHSWMSPERAAFFASLRAMGPVIPVTMRSSKSFEAVSLDLGTRVAVLANGAVLRGEDGAIDTTWMERIAGISGKSDAYLKDMLSEVSRHLGDDVRTWIVSEEGMPIYLCVKSNRDGLKGGQDLEAAKRILSRMPGYDGMRLHINRNNLSMTPAGISKAEAVEYLLSRHPGATSIGVGDSITDLPFMRLCTMAMFPPGSQIDRGIAA